MKTRLDRQQLQRAARLLREARKTVALTGAGISTPSGIPDFRSSDSGLWRRYDPMKVASLTAFRYDPQAFYAWIRPMAKTILDAAPNAAHYALATLEKHGLLAGIITQNIDDLHRRAGSRRVYEIHGHLRTATCIRCFQREATEKLLPAFIESGEVPRCPKCGGVLKPDVVLFGEQLPYQVVAKAEALIARSDLVLVVGSSLEVTPAALFPVTALNAGAQLIIINRDPTYLDERATAIFRQDVALVLPELVEEVLRGQEEG
jgi:NAD-dependent deacetylase